MDLKPQLAWKENKSGESGYNDNKITWHLHQTQSFQLLRPPSRDRALPSSHTPLDTLLAPSTFLGTSCEDGLFLETLRIASPSLAKELVYFPQNTLWWIEQSNPIAQQQLIIWKLGRITLSKHLPSHIASSQSSQSATTSSLQLQILRILLWAL